MLFSQFPSFKKLSFLSLMCIYLWCRRLYLTFRGLCKCKTDAYKNSQFVVSCGNVSCSVFACWCCEAREQSVSWKGELSQFWIVTDVVCQNMDERGFSSFLVKTSFADLWASCHTCCGYKVIPGSQNICKHPGFGSFGRRWLMLPRAAPSSSLSYSLFLSLCTGQRPRAHEQLWAWVGFSDLTVSFSDL